MTSRSSGPESRAVSPHEYDRRILLTVMGLTPQILTETLYALAVRPTPGTPPFLPSEIHVVTTRPGRDLMVDKLLDDGGFVRFCREYDIDPATIRFGADSFHVVSRGGEELADITDDADNTTVADTITGLVRRFTADAAAAVHASLAGGRKTMGFYLGFALSLYGRPQDRLSHVLVSPPFESAPEFYYPPKEPADLVIRGQRVNTRDASVMMADIPFVRLRDGLPQRLVAGSASYSDTVSAAQRALDPPALSLSHRRRRITAGEDTMTLPPADFAFYAYMARRRAADLGFVDYRAEGLAEDYLREYRLATDEYLDTTGRERVSHRLREGADQQWFDERRSKVNLAIRKALGEALGRVYQVASEGTRPDTRYGLRIEPRLILIE